MRGFGDQIDPLIAVKQVEERKGWEQMRAGGSHCMWRKERMKGERLYTDWTYSILKAVPERLCGKEGAMC